MMLEDLNGAASYSTTDLNQVKQQAYSLGSEIEVATERLEMLKAEEKEPLMEFIPGIKEVWDKELKVLN
jgi:hypothetical protein